MRGWYFALIAFTCEVAGQAPINWITDPETGNQYAVLENRVNNKNDAQAHCLAKGGMLPEPRNRRDRSFLYFLTTEQFYLGTSDWVIERHWIWNSDRSLVQSAFWLDGEPDGGRNQNCAVVLRNRNITRWASVRCSGGRLKRTVCEKKAPLHDVVTDPSTGKQYIVLNTSTLNHHINEEICSNHRGHLPEPKNEEENLFLNNLGSDMFILGISRQVEGQWTFDNDGSDVSWMSWVSWSQHPNRPRGGYCVAMLRHHMEHREGSRSQDWIDIPCESTNWLDNKRKSLVCQKYRDDWKTDRRTGKKYLILSTDTLVLSTYFTLHDQLQGVCRNHRGRLPEPQNEMENTFLANLGTGPFMLGMNDIETEGQWVWDSNEQNVTWQNWFEMIVDEPNGGRQRNCALMARQMNHMTGHRTDRWIDIPCDGADNIPGAANLTLICERSQYEWILNTRTGKQYQVLTLGRDFTYDRYKHQCEIIGGKLPEPRDAADNNFLDSLGTEAFVLGINDKEVVGQWVFDSDNSSVTWFNWAHYGGIPNFGRSSNRCVFMVRRHSLGNIPYGHYSRKSWANYRCESTPIHDRMRRQIVCEKKVLTKKVTACAKRYIPVRALFRCPEGYYVQILYATYGRTDNNNNRGCPDNGGPPCNSSIVPLSVDRCTGLYRCSQNVNNQNMGGDPCHGTTKHLHAIWECPRLGNYPVEM